MKKLLLLLTLLYTMAGTAQTITDKHGNVFDIESIEKGSFVDYHIIVQGIFVTKILSVDFTPVAKITKKSVLRYNGQSYKKRGIGLDLMLRMFKDSGFELTERNRWQEIVGQYLQTHIQVTFVKQ